MSQKNDADRASQDDLSPEACRPVDLKIDRKEGLTIQWQDGRTSRYPLAYLRTNCPCATCRIEKPDAPEQMPAGSSGGSISLNVLPAGIDRATEFADAKLVGNYALHILWADGHKTGIYDFRYLRAIDPDA